jgi:hypothetical protein
MPDDSVSKRIRIPHVLLAVTVTGLLIWAVVHGVLHGAIDRALDLSRFITVTLAFATVATVSVRKTNTPKPSVAISVAVGLISSLIIQVSALACISIISSLFDLFRWIGNLNNPSSRAALAGFAVLSLGSLLFYFRLRWRSLYGATEALVGVSVAVHRVIDVKEDQSTPSIELFLALLTASIYLVVRGFDNVHQGLTKEPMDPVATRFLRWLKGQAATRNAQE